MLDLSEDPALDGRVAQRRALHAGLADRAIGLDDPEDVDAAREALLVLQLLLVAVLHAGEVRAHDLVDLLLRQRAVRVAAALAHAHAHLALAALAELRPAPLSVRAAAARVQVAGAVDVAVARAAAAGARARGREAAVPAARDHLGARHARDGLLDARVFGE